MLSIYNKLQTLKATGSTNTKVDLLKEYLEDDLFREIIILMYDEKYHFHINKLPPMTSYNKPRSANHKITKVLRTLAFQKGASDADKNELAHYASIDKETYEVIKCVVTKSAKAGFSHKLLNKAVPNLVYVEPYMRCNTEKTHGKNIVYPAIIQEKADGQFVNIVVDQKGVVFRSRNGKVVQQMNHLIKPIKKLVKRLPKRFYKKVYMGELLVKKQGVILPRKTGNGILNQCLQGTASPEDAKCVIVKLWDCVPSKDFKNRESQGSYLGRLMKVRSFVEAIEDDRFGVIRTKTVKSAKAARKFYRKMRKLGKEGAILKNHAGVWKDHDSPDSIKMKNVSDATLRIIDWKYGKPDSKYEKVMGSIKVETECGLCQVWVSGFSDKEREEDWDEQIGSLVDIEFEGIIESKSRRGIKALYLPQYVEIRMERSTADTLEDLKKRC